VAKALDPQIYPNQTANYLLTMVNRRTEAANDVTLDLSVPSGATVVSTAGACAQGFPCSLGTVAPGAVLLTVVTLHVGSPASNPFVVSTVASVSNPSASDILHSASTLPAINSTGCSSTQGPPVFGGLVLSLLFVVTRRRSRP